MHISWFTVIAQIVNFLILAWLLKKFLYKPILKAIDDREAKIAGQLKDADNKNIEAGKEKADFLKKNEDLQNNTKVLMAKAVSEAATEKAKLIEEAKATAAKLGASLQKSADEEQSTLNKEMANKIQTEIFSVTRKALTELASISLEEQSVNIFVKHAKELKDDEKKKFKDAFQSNANVILVTSAFDIPANQREQLNDVVNGILETKTTLQFKIVPDLISGIELSSNGYKLAWSFADYLNTIENSIVKNLKNAPEKAA